MNEKIASILALAFLLGFSIYNLIVGILQVKKKKDRSMWSWIRMSAGLVILLLTSVFYVNIILRKNF
ncbi:MAG: hypothetical protein KDD52_04845 [Bdellovibrionales bacterium]|nr:hypothetical protein [Bdellovibrionales bacterium]